MKRILIFFIKSKSKNLYVLLFLWMIATTSFAQTVAINTTLSAGNPASGLDVDFPSKGMLITRVALTGSSSFAPLSSHVAGMIVYNTATTADVTPGLYYNDGTKWNVTVPQPGVAAGNMQYWNGNAWVLIPSGQAGQKLQISSTGIPAWSNGALATLTTTAITGITSATATSGGNIANDGGFAVTARGVCWNTITGPTTANSKTADGAGLGNFISNISGLTTLTNYYLRAYASNSVGTAYGNEISFVTP